MWLRLLLFLLFVSVRPAAAVDLTRGPYLQLLTTTSVTVVWNTNVVAACSLAIAPVGGTATVIAGGAGTRCVMAVQGLTPGGEYAYVPRADGVPLRSESVFQTDHPTLPFTFVVFGDSGDASPSQFAVRDRLLATPADFLLHTGDMIYENGAAADFDPRYFVPYADLIRELVLWPTVGNHDVAAAGGGGAAWRDAFFTPANNPAGSEQYYSFDFGNAHVAVIDSNANLAPGSAQYQFLDADLGASTAVWKFVAFHHPPYSSSGSTTSIRTNLGPLFDRHRVPVVFTGHEHNYERTRPLRGGQVVPAGEGTVYVTTGGGGRANLYPVTPSSFTAYAEAAHHVTRVAIDGDTLRLDMVRVDGAVRDTMTLRAPRVVAPVADTYVESTAAGTSFGSNVLLTADASPSDVSYLRFVVGGVGAGTVTRAVLRLQVDAGSGGNSNSGGRVQRISNVSWPEATTTWSNRPALDGTVLATQGAVSLSQVVDFDVSTAVTGDGTYSFAVDSTSTDGVRYRSRDATSGRPVLILTLAASAPATTTTTVPPAPTTSTSSSSTSSTSSSSSSSTSTTTSSTVSTTSTSLTTTTAPSTSTSSTSSTSSSTSSSSSTSAPVPSTSSSSSSTSSTSTSSSSSSTAPPVPTTSSTSSTTSTTAGPPAAGPVAAYGFNEGAGSTVADASGRGNAGTTSSTTWTTAGRFGAALVFNGTGSWVTVPDAASIDLTGALTIEAWVYPTVAPTGWRTVIAKEQTGGVVYFLHAGSSSSNRPATGVAVAGTEQTLFGVAQLAANTWTHLAATYDGAAQRLYVNGTQVATRAQTGAVTVSSGALRIGGNGSWGEYFQGRIDEVRVYNRALTATQIQSDMNAAVAP